MYLYCVVSSLYLCCYKLSFYLFNDGEIKKSSEVLRKNQIDDNAYTGIDISPGLLRRAAKNFKRFGFHDAEFYVADATDLPFRDNFFDLAMCHLSLNFFDDTESFISELKRVLVPGGYFICSVPLPELKPPRVKIRGTLHTYEALRNLFRKHEFDFEKLPHENGALLYFKAKLND